MSSPGEIDPDAREDDVTSESASAAALTVGPSLAGSSKMAFNSSVVVDWLQMILFTSLGLSPLLGSKV